MNSAANHTSGQPARNPVLYWLRWALVPFAMGAAFVVAGVAGMVSSIALDSEKGLPVAGMAAAFGWVLAAALVAPSHKRTAATVAFVVGTLLALLLSRALPVPGVLWWGAFAAACGSGFAALAFVLSLYAYGPSAPATMSNSFGRLIRKGKAAMQNEPNRLAARRAFRLVPRALILVALAWGGWTLARGVIDIISQQSRGLHLRMGRYVATLDPGLHLKIPLVDRIIGVEVIERQGYIQHVDAMTQDNVIMKLSLQYTFEVSNPRRYRLEVSNADAIIREFVQGKMRDIVNTISMNDVMKKRLELGQHITAELASKEHDFGVHFKLVQVQGAFPPAEVQDAIKQRMVSEQQTVAAKEQAAQKQIIADASFYEAGRHTEAMRIEIEERARAQKTAVDLLLEALSKHEALGRKYLDLLMAQELKSNSKWILSGGAVPQIHLDPESAVSGP